MIRHLRVEHDFPLASYQPKFLIDQVRSACKFEGIEPQFRKDLVEMALGNLFTRDTPGYRDPNAVEGEDRAPEPAVLDAAA